MDPRSGTGPVRCRLISHTAARRTIARPLGPHQSGSSGQTFRCDSCWSGWLCPPAESQTEVTALSKPSRHSCRQNALAALLATSAIGVAPQKIILDRIKVCPALPSSRRASLSIAARQIVGADQTRGNARQVRPEDHRTAIGDGARMKQCMCQTEFACFAGASEEFVVNLPTVVSNSTM